MTEQLKIVIEAVDKGATKTVNNLKQSLNSMNKSSGSGVSKQMDAITVSANKASKAASALGKAFKAVGIAVGTIAVIKFGQNAIAQANKVESAFMGLQSILEGQGRSFNKAKAFIDDYVSDGLVPLSDATTAYKNLAARGYSTEQIQKSMIALKDAAAFGRQSSLSLGEAVSSATEGLKNENSMLVDNAGVTKNVAKMWDEYAKSIGKSTNELTKQDKIQAEVNGIMKETQFQTGDAAKLAGTWQGQVAKLNAQWVTFSASIGAMLKTVLTPLLGILNGLMSAVNGFIGALGNAIKAITGKNPFQAMADSATNASTAVTSVGDAATEAGKDAKKAAKNFGAFDELQVMDSGNSSTSTSTTGGGTTSFTPEVDVTEASKGLNKFEMAVQDTLKRIGKQFETIDTGKIKDAFFNLGDAVKGLAGVLGEFGLYVLENVLAPIAVWFADSVLPAVIDKITGCITLLKLEFELLGGVFQAVFENFIAPLGEFLSAIFTPILEGMSAGIKDIVAMFTDMSKWVADNKTKLDEFLAPVKEFIENITKWVKENETLNKVLEFLGFVLASVAAAYTLVQGAILAYNVVMLIATGISSAFGAVMAFITSPISLVVLAIAAVIAIGVLLYKNWDSIISWAGSLWNSIKSIFGKIGSFVGDVWKGIVNGAIGMVNTVIKVIETMANAWLTPFNLIIKGLNKIPGVNISLLKVDLPSIPKLEEGGIVNKGQMFIAGENGKEAIMPLENNTGWITELASKINGGSNNTPQNIQMNVDNRRFAEIVISSLNQYVTDTGSLPILLG